MAENEEELQSLLMRMKEKSEKNNLKFNINNNKKKPQIMTSSLITSWQMEGEKVEIVTDFLLLGSKITADDDSNHEIKKSHSQAYTLRKPKLKNTCIPLIIAALPMIARTWKQPRCPSIDEWMKKL